jgi:hypothetical protein
LRLRKQRRRTETERYANQDDSTERVHKLFLAAAILILLILLIPSKIVPFISLHVPPV